MNSARAYVSELFSCLNFVERDMVEMMLQREAFARTALLPRAVVDIWCNYGHKDAPVQTGSLTRCGRPTHSLSGESMSKAADIHGHVGKFKL